MWGAVIASFASGFGQFGVVTALGSVARTFGHLAHGATLADQAGLSGTKLGVGLAIIRLASLGGLPLTAMADRFGRHRMLVTTVGLGLMATVMAAASPGYWWFVVIFACGRPLLSATNALSEVIAAEQTNTQGRAKPWRSSPPVTALAPAAPRSSTASLRRPWGFAVCSCWRSSRSRCCP